MFFDPQKIRPPHISLFFLMAAIGLHFWLKPFMIIPHPYNWLGLIVMADGIFIMGRAHKSFTTQDTPVSHAETPRTVVTGGLFRHSRNPMYVGVSLIFFGIACTAGTWPFFAGWALTGIMLHFIFIPWEERRMEELFGQEYLDYKKQTRRWV